jgi:RNA 2',3'-cyclic 3'-phosphodiesterase
MPKEIQDPNKKNIPVRSRCFIAVELSKDAKDELSRIIAALKTPHADVKWMLPETMHLTLKFLGDVTEHRSEDIKRLLTEVARNNTSFDILLSGVGVFPDWKHPKVVWAGIGTGADNTESLAKEVEDAMALTGFAREGRLFRPHLTIGRVKQLIEKKEFKKKAEGIAVNPAQSHVNEIVMFRSKLTPEGAIHTPLARFQLAG